MEEVEVEVEIMKKTTYNNIITITTTEDSLVINITSLEYFIIVLLYNTRWLKSNAILL